MGFSNELDALDVALIALRNVVLSDDDDDVVVPALQGPSSQVLHNDVSQFGVIANNGSACGWNKRAAPQRREQFSDERSTMHSSRPPKYNSVTRIASVKTICVGER